MATAAQVRDAFTRYCERLTAHDAAGIAALYAEGATLTDPAGAVPVVGRAAIEAFYAGALARVQPDEVALTGPVRVLADGSAGAAPLVSRRTVDGAEVRLEIIDVMTFDDDGRITSMTAYWGPDNLR